MEQGPGEQKPRPLLCLSLRRSKGLPAAPVAAGVTKWVLLPGRAPSDRWPIAGRHFITNRAHGALGYSLGAAIGAQIGRPNATVLSVMGDGSFGFCCGEFETITRYNLPIKSIVFSNAAFGWIKAGQKAGFDKRYYNVDFNRTDHAAVANAFGVRSWRVEDPTELPKIIAESLAHDGPTLIDVISQSLQEAAAPVSEWVA